MKKKLMVMLLCATMATTALAGCGSKETDAESVESTSTESTEEATSEVAESSVEVVPEIESDKDKEISEENVITMDFGTITFLGENKDYPTDIVDLEINFNGQTFQMALPEDMCVDFAYDLEKNILNIFNEDRTRRVWIYFTEFTQPEEYKHAYDTESTKEFIALQEFTAIPDKEVVTLADEEFLIVQRIPASANLDGRTYYGEHKSTMIYDTNVETIQNEDGTTTKRYKGIEYTFYYGETDAAAAGMATYISDSFVVVGEGGSHTTTKPPVVDENAEDLTKYGMPENVSLPNGAELRDLDGRMAINVANATDEEMIAFIDAFASEVEWVGTYEFVDTMDGAGIIAECKKTPTLYKFTYTFNGEEYVFNIRYMDGKYTMGLAKNK